MLMHTYTTIHRFLDVTYLTEVGLLVFFLIVCYPTAPTILRAFDAATRCQLGTWIPRGALLVLEVDGAMNPLLLEVITCTLFV